MSTTSKTLLDAYTYLKREERNALYVSDGVRQGYLQALEDLHRLAHDAKAQERMHFECPVSFSDEGTHHWVPVRNEMRCKYCALPQKKYREQLGKECTCPAPHGDPPLYTVDCPVHSWSGTPSTYEKEGRTDG